MQLSMSKATSWLCLQDSINMQINNLARDNLHDKLDILSDLVTDEYWPWFANYMVVKRAAQVWRLQLLIMRICLLLTRELACYTSCFYSIP